MIYDRLEKTNKRWINVLHQVLLTYNYKMKHSTIKMTPIEARKPSNKIEVQLNLEMSRNNNRIYPNISIGDKVKIYKKKDKLDKERVSVWTDNAYEVENITESLGQKFYKVAGRDRPFT
jgi:hypothetical protein